MWDPREREDADRVDDFSPRSRDDAREDSFDDDDDDDDITLDLDLDLAGDVFTNGHESLSPAVGARAMEDDEGDEWDGGSMMREGSDDRGVDRGVRGRTAPRASESALGSSPPATFSRLGIRRDSSSATMRLAARENTGIHLMAPRGNSTA